MEHDELMLEALRVARRAGSAGELPCGAIVVRDDRVISEGPNCARSEMDPTAHAEVVAIRRAAKRLSTLDLTGCTLYVTIEPCPMCCWSILVSGISCLVLGARHADIGRPDLGTYCVEELLKMTGRPLQVITGIREHECAESFRPWLKTHGPPGPSAWTIGSASNGEQL